MTKRLDLNSHHARRTHLSARMAAVTPSAHDAGDTLAIREPMALVRAEIRLAREHLNDAHLPADDQRALDGALQQITRTVFAGRDFLGGARTAVWHNSRGQSKWSVFCACDPQTCKPDTAKFDHVQSRIAHVQAAIAHAKETLASIVARHEDAPVRTSLRRIGKGLDSLQLLMVQSARSITHFAREDGMTR